MLFLPDQHLGRNTAYKMGVPLDQMVVWDPNEIWGGLEPDAVQARADDPVEGALLGAHALHRARRSSAFREQHPGIRVIVHPEVPWDVVQAADDSGSTEYIIKTVQEEPGRDRSGPSAPKSTSSTASRTRSRPTAPSLSLDQFGCLCSTMFRVSPNHLLWMLEGLVDGQVHNRIVVPDDQKHWTQGRARPDAVDQ